jgi:hypothetical protein
LILKIFKSQELEVLWFWKLSKTPHNLNYLHNSCFCSRSCDFWSLISAKANNSLVFHNDISPSIGCQICIGILFLHVWDEEKCKKRHT